MATFKFPPPVSKFRTLSVDVDHPINVISNLCVASIVSLQLPVSAVPSSAVHGLPGIPTVIGTQCYQNGRRFASGQEAQVSRQPLLEDPVELLDPSVTDLPLQPLTSMYVGGNETNVEDLRSRSNVQDFRSTDTFLGSLDDHLLHNNHVTPEITQPSCSDPLQIEMERIKKDDVQDLKIHAEMVCSRWI